MLNLLLTLGLAALSPPTDSLLLLNLDLPVARDAWLGQDNAAALTRYPLSGRSRAEVYGRTGQGGLVDYSQSPHSWQTGASVESYQRLSAHTVVYGRMSYDNFSGRDMTGSVFIDPSRYPFDIVEDSIAQAGKKHLDTYRLTGALGTRVWRQLSLGARLDYTAANYAKYRDMRHQNKLMQLDLTAGFHLPLGSHLALGAHYRYLRHTESVRYSTYGKTDRPYLSLISYGGFIGQLEQHATDGLTGSNREQPFFDERQGYGVQLGWDIRPGLSWHNSWSMDVRRGYYGRQSPYTIVYMRHRGHDYRYASTLTLRRGKSLHRLALGLEANRVDNLAQHYREQTGETGSSYYDYYEPVKTGNKLWSSTDLTYTSYLALRGEEPLWTVSAAILRRHRKHTAYDYPYYRRQHWDATTASLGLARSLFLRRGILTLELTFDYGKGSGEPYEDGTFIAPSDKQTAPPEATALLWREYARLMAPQYQFGGRARYAFQFPATRLKTYVQAAVSTRHANTHLPTQAGRSHWEGALTLGCAF